MRKIRAIARTPAFRGSLAALVLGLALAMAGCPGKKSDSTYSIGFNFHVIAMDENRADAVSRINTMVDEVKRLFLPEKFEIDSVEIYYYSDESAQRLTNIDIYRDEDNNGWPDDMEELLTWSGRTPNQNIDIFLVKSFGDIGILGAAGNIPGPAKKGTKRSGVILNTLGGLYQMSPSELNLQGGTLAHESVHYLGVYHTTEREGRDFDYLKDTPECPQWTFDRNSDGLVSPNECFGQDAQYMMFWAAGNFAQDIISQEQTTVIRLHALVRKK